MLCFFCLEEYRPYPKYCCLNHDADPANLKYKNKFVIYTWFSIRSKAALLIKNYYPSLHALYDINDTGCYLIK